ncbi:hypothetical protein [Cellulomonas sp. URHE0023]|uniref:hypothetical protein n=1 Tax=Cellulomonas sp. URHE0023 TaxID=1380354 RepID=UPI00068E3841|nr:hypothetical protein [Cellulomonas sp. URHE0023]
MSIAITRSERWATTALFLVSGLSFGGFLVRSPTLKVERGLDDTSYGLLSVLFGVVAIVTMRSVAPVLRRVGPSVVARVAVVAFPLAVVVLGVPLGIPGYVVAIVLVAAANGALDVAMNATAVGAEQRLGRPMLSGCHAAWSVGATTAMLAGTASIAAGAPTTVHLAAAAALAVPIAVLAGSRLPGNGPATVGPESPAPARWSAALVRVALVGVILMVAEGAALGWSGVFLHEVRGAPLALAAAATTAFTAAQTVGRLGGDRLRGALGDARLFRVGSLVGAVGLAAAVLVPRPAAAVGGFALLGLGGAALVPIAYAETGRRDPSTLAVARLSVFVYAGVLVGPGMIGLVAGALGLTAALALVAPLLGLGAVVFPRAERRLGAVGPRERAGVLGR